MGWDIIRFSIQFIFHPKVVMPEEIMCIESNHYMATFIYVVSFSSTIIRYTWLLNVQLKCNLRNGSEGLKCSEK